ncbi:hypothetical protein BU16DRAFT_564439 [Lophium mytilinum]|uniref:Uncharacterized protein n=1 Tax=Lophium mytilinum TaxID=390894 RepID=A0A6A6QJ03_9PEZI|nr:hypothetical protein BU16DRAFT_564439 [Lophium mytilinum]
MTRGRDRAGDTRRAGASAVVKSGGRVEGGVTVGRCGAVEQQDCRLERDEAHAVFDVLTVVGNNEKWDGPSSAAAKPAPRCASDLTPIFTTSNAQHHGALQHSLDRWTQEILKACLGVLSPGRRLHWIRSCERRHGHSPPPDCRPPFARL